MKSAVALRTVNLNVTLPNERDCLTVPDHALSAGEALALFGPIGSGKTTLLRVLAGFWSNWTGSIYVNDTELRRISPSKSPVILVWQDHRLFDHLSVEENALFPLRARGLLNSDSRKVARQMLGALDLEEKLGSMPHELSGGQRQMASIARSLVACRFHGVSVLALDEPFRNLDSGSEFLARRLLKDIQAERGFATIEISHSLNSVTTIGRKIGIIEHGACCFFGGIDDLINSVANHGRHLVRLELANQVGGVWKLVEPLHLIKCDSVGTDSSHLTASVLTVERTALGDKLTLVLDDKKRIHTFTSERSTLKAGDTVVLSAVWGMSA